MWNYEKCCFVRILTSFGLWSNLGLTKGILVILAKKGTSRALVPEWITSHCFGFSSGPMERKWYFWIFQGPARKSRVDKIRYQQLPLLYLISQMQWEVLDKECDFEFCCPLDLCAETIHGSRLDFTYLDRFATVAIEIFSGHISAL